MSSRMLVKKVRSASTFSVKLFVLVSVFITQSGLIGASSFGSGNSRIPMALAASSPSITTYVVPAISDTKILPASSLPDSRKGSALSVRVSPGEYRALSFVVNSSSGIDALQVESSKLSAGNNTIAASNVDIRAVKVWYQGSANKNISVTGRYLTPELLLKNDSLVKVEGDNWNKWDVSNPDGKNYLKVNGSYIDISDGTHPNGDFAKDIPISERPIKDATSLQPVNLPANYNKQFWITLHVPDGADAGTYKGNITLKSAGEVLKTLSLKVEVLPIKLLEPNVEYSSYYYGLIKNEGGVSAVSKTAEQYAAEMKDMLEHGITNPNTSVYQNTKPDAEDTILQMLSIRQKAGMDNTNFYNRTISDEKKISYYKALLAPYGVVNFWMYGPDEKDLNTPENRKHINDVHAAGGKYFNAQTVDMANSVADILDLAIVSYAPSSSLAAKYHSYGHKVYSYANPQAVPDLPRLFRQNYGLTIWQADYDGVMDYLYGSPFRDPWNDFDYSKNEHFYRDHEFTYPTANGVIDTVKWEGFREGVNDMRYLATLQKAIKAKGSEDATAKEAQKYLTKLKSSNLANQDLDATRSDIIGYILALQSPSAAHTLTVKNGTGSGSYTEGSKIDIVADAAPAGKTFDKWTGDTKYVSNPTSPTTTVTMPNKAITIVANYKNDSAKKYTLNIKSGTGSGSYAEKTKVTITANTPSTGKVFDKWTGDTKYIANPASSTTTVTMPTKNITLTAIYKSITLTQALKATVTSKDTKIAKGTKDVTLVEADLINTGTETLAISGLGIMADYGNNSVNNVKLYLDNANMGAPTQTKVYEVIYKSLPLQIEAGKTVKLTLKGDVSSKIKFKGLGFRLDSCTNIFTVKGVTTGKKAKLNVSGKSYLYFTSK